MKNVLLIVIYKQRIEDSSTVVSFCENCISFHNKMEIVIWDNSPDNINTEILYLKQQNFSYQFYHTPQNLPLSVIYNKVADNYPNCDILHLFDQDSVITEAYFDLMYKAIAQNADIGLFVPYIKYENMIVSPGDFKLYKGRHWKNLIYGKISSKNKLCITSGMGIRISMLTTKSVRFDEHLSLYGIDTKFCLDYSFFARYIYVLNYKLEHSLSMFENESIEIRIYRYKSHMNSLRYITKKISIIAYFLALVVTHIHYWKLLLIRWRENI